MRIAVVQWHDLFARAALDKRGETGVLSNTDVHYYGPLSNA